MRRFGFARACAAAAIAAVVVLFASIQVASDALEARAAVPGSVPTLAPRAFGLALYRALGRATPATYVDSTLAQAALDDGRTLEARRYALRLAASPVRDELLARIALARGDRTLALEYFLAAPDAAAVQTRIDQRAQRDPAGAYRLERLLNARLSLLATHPDAVADTFWRLGVLAAQRSANANGAARRAWLQRSLRHFEAAAALAPLSDKYLLSAANQELALGHRTRARAFFLKAFDADPASANAIAGLGVVSFQEGDVAAARVYLRRARSFDARAGMVIALEHDLR